MGSINLRRGELVGSTTETVGYKSGVALTREHAHDILGAEYAQLWTGPDDEPMRVRSEVYEGLFIKLLHGVGATPSRSPLPTIALYHKYKHDHEALELYMAVGETFAPALERAMRAIEGTDRKSIDPTEYIEEMRSLHGPAGAFMACEMLDAFSQQMFQNPWSRIRRVDWPNVVELEDLFRSESLEAHLGRFIDQRFIDYLARNFPEVDRINWRKFEALTAEFFDRQGWKVEIGPGRNDDGIDVRVWHTDPERVEPPVILIQCKRQKTKVEKVVVKALYADVDAENATSGLIVTTNTLSRGALQVVTSRGYPVSQANRAELKRWIYSMRTPGTGAFAAD